MYTPSMLLCHVPKFRNDEVSAIVFRRTIVNYLLKNNHLVIKLFVYIKSYAFGYTERFTTSG